MTSLRSWSGWVRSWVGEPARHLHVIDADTGEVVKDGCPNCAVLEDHIAGLERDIRGWTVRYANLKRDKDAEARDHELWPKAYEVFKYWRERCRHPRCKFTPERFALLLPFLNDHGSEACQRAIDGAAFDPFVTRRKNGSLKRHDGFELVFRDAGKFEEFVNRAPTS